LAAVLLFIYAFGEAPAAPTAEERRRMIREFEAANQAQQETEKEEGKQRQPPEERGLEPLREELNEARGEFLRDKSPEHRARAETATLDYVEPLARLRRFEEALSQIELTIDLIGRQPALLERIVGIRFDQAEGALAKGDFLKATQALEKAGGVAKSGNLREVVSTVERALRDVYFEWAQEDFMRGDWRRARERAQQALVYGAETQPVQAFLARISYLSNEHSKALKELDAALSGPYREAPEYLRFAEVLKWESYLERSYRRIPKEGILLSIPTGLVVNDRAMEEAFATARSEASRVFGIEIPFGIPISVYQRSEFLQFCQSPQWRGAASIEGKLRIRSDILTGGKNEMEKVALYGYGLWVTDLLSGGRAPAWVREGFAHQLALPTGPPNGALGTLKRLAGQGRYPPFESLEVSFNRYEDIGEAAQALAQAQTAIQLVLEKKGLGAVVQLIHEFRYPVGTEDVMRKILGYDYPSFTQAWSDSMQSGFATKAYSDQSALRSFGVVSPVGSYWER
jgi:hypothetical protein